MQVQTPLVLVLNAATEIERKRQVDTYLVAYWIYKYKMSFTTGDKTHEVPPPPPHFIAILYVYFYFDTFICDIVCVRLQLLEQLHCTDKKAVANLTLSRNTIARHVRFYYGLYYECACDFRICCDRYGLTICDALSSQTKQLLLNSVAR
jgi:hypothetical protein